MARPIKEGIGYFPLDTDFFYDDKILEIESDFGIKGSYVAIRLLCLIYSGNGYYYQWGEKQAKLFARRLGEGFSAASVQEIVNGLVRCSFFDKGVFDTFGILTSEGIQKRYYECVKRTRTKVLFAQDLCLIQDLPQVNNSFPAENPDKPQNNALKENKIKENKIKERETRAKNRQEIQHQNLNGTFFARLRSDQMKIQSIGAACSITEQEVLSMLDAYARWLEVGERRKLTYGEYCGTFMTWIQYELKQQSNKNGTNKNGHGAIDIGANRPEDYRAQI